jgi:hypothetical protein
MPANHLTLIAFAAVVLGAPPAPRAADVPARPTRQDAEALKQKIAAMAERRDVSARQPVRTTVSEREVNAYLAYETGDLLPAGVVSPTLSMLGAGRVSGRAVVDLDRVRLARKPTSLLDPVSYLRGKLPVEAVGTVTARNGVAAFQLESASVAGVPVPKIVLQQIVSFYSRSDEDPDGIGLDDQIALPSRIRDIHVERGRAVIVQ